MSSPKQRIFHKYLRGHPKTDDDREAWSWACGVQKNWGLNGNVERGILRSMAIDWNKPLFEATPEEKAKYAAERTRIDTIKKQPCQLDSETVYLIQFACRAVIFMVLLSLYAASVSFVVIGCANDNGGFTIGGLIMAIGVAIVHAKMRTASIKW